MFWIIGVCAVCYVLCMPLYMHYKPFHLHLGCAYKSLGTLCAFLMALIAAIKLDPRCYIISGAILLYAVADYLLEFQFELGAGIFMAGHICAIAFFLSLAPVSGLHLICLLLLGGMIAVVFMRWRKPIGKKLPFFVIYGASLIIMCASALGCFPTNGITGILIACGGALFCISDFMLLRRTLFPSGVSLSWAIMVSYYSAVLLFGIACLQL